MVGQQRCFDAGEVTFILQLFPNQSPQLTGCGSSGSDHHAAQLVPSLRTRQQDQGELGAPPTTVKITIRVMSQPII